MPNNYVLLETIALTQSAASVTFDNLPTSGYTDLKVVASARGVTVRADDYLKIAFNNVSTNQTARLLYGTGSAAGSQTDTLIYGPISGDGGTASTFGSTEFYIPNYRSTTAAKSVSIESVQENNTTTATMYLNAGLWNPSTQAAITTITLSPYYGTGFTANSTFSLYGVAALGTTPVLAPKATGGNIVANDGTYWYHAFTSSGNFVPQTGLTCDVLTVAGGGAGAWGNGGGGGAGGLVYLTGQSVTTSTQAVTVGAGASRITTAVGQQEANGSNSQFASLTAAAGGGGGATFSNTKGALYNGKDGGSGGGGGGSDNAPVNAGGAGNTPSTSPSQGNNGGSGTANSTFNAGGGGGGAGAVGSNGTNPSTAGAGGAGSGTYSSWGTATLTGVSGFYAGGGGGGGNGTGAAGGSGGGGAGGTNAVGTAGISNTGSGGGGGGGGSNGGNGASGIVIIRYPIN